MKKTVKDGGGNASKRFGTRIVRCDCAHRFQDAQYGTQQRVHNLNASGAAGYCTVCGSKKTFNA